jgi:hypothetical protein
MISLGCERMDWIILALNRVCLAGTSKYASEASDFKWEISLPAKKLLSSQEKLGGYFYIFFPFRCQKYQSKDYLVSRLVRRPVF